MGLELVNRILEFLYRLRRKACGKCPGDSE